MSEGIFENTGRGVKILVWSCLSFFKDLRKNFECKWIWKRLGLFILRL